VAQYKIATIPGDGIGPEVTDSAVKVLKAVSSDLEFTYFEAGYNRFKEKGESITNEILEEIKKFDAILFGAVASPLGDVKNYRSAILTIRRYLDLYANIRPVKSYVKKNNFDVIIFRENTEGLYSEREYMDMRSKEMIAGMVVTEEKSRRIAEIAYRKAVEWGRKKVTIVHKANVLRFSDGLFSKVCRSVSEKYPEIETDEKYIDNTCYQIVRNPSSFDVIVTTNLYGDILGDLAAGVGDGLGFAPSAQLGDRWALFEPVHGSAPKYTGQNKVNPIAQIFSAKMMLEYLGLSKEANITQKAVEEVLEEGKVRTYDIGGTSKTSEMTEAIVASILKKI
jgi:isocitrate dehydrogenase (NAD+)